MRVVMFHPDAGLMSCSPSAVAGYERKGWTRADGMKSVQVSAADGSPLTTGTVFPPETFDDGLSPSTDHVEPGADDSKTATSGTTKTKGRTAAKPEEAQ